MAGSDSLSAWVLLEQQLDALTCAVDAGHANALRDSSQALRDAMVALMADIRAGAWAPAEQEVMRRRLQQLAIRLSIQRAGMMRRAALVDQTLQAMVPGALSTTYDPTPAPYGSVRKQTGAFKTLAA